MTYGYQRGINPYDDAKRYATWGAIGQAGEQAKGLRANLASSGMLSTPGVMQAASNRLAGDVNQRIGQIGSQYDIARINFDEQQRQFDARLAFAREQEQNAKDAATKAFWGHIIGGLIGAGGTIVSGGLSSNWGRGFK